MTKKSNIEVEKVNSHIVNWLKTYAENAKVNGFVVGISGGVDSAVTSTLCAQTGLTTLCVEMPIHQAPNQVSRAKEHIEQLKQRFPNVNDVEADLTSVFEDFKKVIPNHTDIAKVNLSLANSRARLRMTTLYYFAGIHGLLVAGTGNKVEDFGVGFYTKYGDGGVDLSPIADLMKSDVYALGEFLKIPTSILVASPTDGLFGDDRTDEDQLGASYDELEWAMLEDEKGKTADDFTARKRTVFEIYKRLNTVNKHKMDEIPVCKIPKNGHSIGEGTSVNVEWVSANPTGPLHVGHGRNASYGDSVVRLLERIGHTVTREFYLNDRGTQMQNYVDSLIARKKGEQPPEDGYHGAYIVEWAKEMPDDVDPLEWGEARAIEDHRQVLSAMHIAFDVWFSERSLVESGAVEAALDDLRSRDMAYELDGATWFRTTTFGDDKDRVLIKSDGEFTYMLPDIAYHRDKYSRGFDLLIDVWGADHHGYVPRMKAAVEALGHDPDTFQVELTQLVKLVRDGKEVKLSKRTGDIIELREVIDEVGADSARLTFLLQSIDTSQTFDIDVVKSQAMENPVFYVQMAYARIRSIKRKADELGVARIDLTAADLSLLVEPRELDILRALSELPDVVLTAAKDRAPHRITTWVRELAGAFHGFYHDCYVISDQTSPELTQARLWLVEAAEIGLAIGLDLLGVSAPESM